MHRGLDSLLGIFKSPHIASTLVELSFEISWTTDSFRTSFLGRLRRHLGTIVFN